MAQILIRPYPAWVGRTEWPIGFSTGRRSPVIDTTPRRIVRHVVGRCRGEMWSGHDVGTAEPTGTGRYPSA
jgi:hypothetical protein